MAKGKFSKPELLRNRVLVVLIALITVTIAAIFITSIMDNKPVEHGGFDDEVSSESEVPDSSEPEELPPEEEKEPPKETASSYIPGEWSEADRKSKYFEEELPILVNPDHKIPEGYEPDLVQLVDHYQLDRRAAAAYWDMWTACKNDLGKSFWVISAYRSMDKQVSNFNAKIKEYQNMGYSYEDAYKETATYIAVPGTSEHTLGLAVDVNSLQESFENTDFFKWLYSHCADYGFILRYPKDKEDITKIAYEPWHYRYVGTNHAKIIMENKLCLEEYLGITE